MAVGYPDYYSPYEQLADVIVNVYGRRFEGYAPVTTTCVALVGPSALGMTLFFAAHHDNTDDVYIYSGLVCGGAALITLSPGETYAVYGFIPGVSAKSASGTQYLKAQV